jgi:hypothetical protein
VGNDPSLQKQLLLALHDSTVGGPSSTLVTYRRVKQTFAWRCLKRDIQQFVQNCQVCIQAKADRSA